MGKQMSSGKKRAARPKTLQRQLLEIFKRIRSRDNFSSPPASELKFRFDEAVFSAAIAKCVDLNVLINSGEIGSKNSFLFIANLRGVAEDLIVLQFLQDQTTESRQTYLTLLQEFSLVSGLLAQVTFFEMNNPFQPVIGGNASALEASRLAGRQSLRAFWKALGEPKKDGPTVRDMAERTGLTSTYNYIYFLSSNFVHFNPHPLLRMGWGPEEGPFEFSVHNFAGYYEDVASFYGAILLLGFYFRIGRQLFSPETEHDIQKILETLDGVPRWPEIVTYEELNRRAPMLHFMAHAMNKVSQESGEQVPYGAILREVRGLSSDLAPQ